MLGVMLILTVFVILGIFFKKDFPLTMDRNLDIIQYSGGSGFFKNDKM